jgi:twitching motility two-component system response regulator PilH
MISEEEIVLAGVSRVQLTGTAGRDACVLLAEDDKALRRYLEVVLERAGYRVESAADGLEAMKLLLSKSIDLVITDAVMPNLSGNELCRFIRSTRHLANLPIVLLSALDPRNAGAETEQADAFLAKPVSPDQLLQTIALQIEFKVR